MYGDTGRNSWCERWQSLASRLSNILLMPAFEHHQLPQPKRVVALAGDMFVNELADE